MQNAPQGDLVGAIGEAGINAREFGAIQITERFSLVECQRRVPRRSSRR